MFTWDWRWLITATPLQKRYLLVAPVFPPSKKDPRPTKGLWTLNCASYLKKTIPVAWIQVETSAHLTDCVTQKGTATYLCHYFTFTYGVRQQFQSWRFTTLDCWFLFSSLVPVCLVFFYITLFYLQQAMNDIFKDVFYCCITYCCVILPCTRVQCVAFVEPVARK